MPAHDLPATGKLTRVIEYGSGVDTFASAMVRFANARDFLSNYFHAMPEDTLTHMAKEIRAVREEYLGKVRNIAERF